MGGLKEYWKNKELACQKHSSCTNCVSGIGCSWANDFGNCIYLSKKIELASPMNASKVYKSSNSLSRKREKNESPSLFTRISKSPYLRNELDALSDHNL